MGSTSLGPWKKRIIFTSFVFFAPESCPKLALGKGVRLGNDGLKMTKLRASNAYILVSKTILQHKDLGLLGKIAYFKTGAGNRQEEQEEPGTYCSTKK